MKSALVGYTGFVGSNIAAKNAFDGLYNSKNIDAAFGTRPDLLVFAGLRAEKFLINTEPEEDIQNMRIAMENIQKIAPKKLVFVSTIDVYKEAINVDEDTEIDTVNLLPYGLHRFQFEEWIEVNFKDYLIIRLPALYGDNLKKNFIFDLVNVIPSMLTEIKFNELKNKDALLSPYYKKKENGFYVCKALSDEERRTLRHYFMAVGFSALNFTDSRASFQFYNLAYFWKHIQLALKNNIKIVNIATEPVQIGELYKYVKQNEFSNEISSAPPRYDFKTKYSDIFGGKDGYIHGKDFLLEDIKQYIRGYSA